MMILLRFMIVVVCVLASASALDHEEYLVGTLNNQPLANMHLVMKTVEVDGISLTETQATTEIVLKRQLGEREIVFAIRQFNRMLEDQQGVTEMLLEQEEGGARTIARAKVIDGAIVGELTKAGQTTPLHVALPEGVQLTTNEAVMRLASDATLQVGDRRTMHAPSLFGGTVAIMTLDAELKQRAADGALHLRVTVRQMPGFPYDVVVESDGRMRLMTLNFGLGIIEMAPSDGPVELGGAALAMTGVLDAVGRPANAAANAYRMPAESLASLPVDAFQQRRDDLLVVTRDGGPGFAPKPGEYLQAAPQLQTDRPELQAWVAKQLKGHDDKTVAQRAERLRLAVRAYIIPDLSRGDASALEVLHERRGDCTEYAHLLAAACRIAGIPARVEFGLVYAASLGGWGGHAWNSIWDAEQETWLHLDAAYVGVVRSQYIRTGSGLEHGSADAALDAGMGLLLGKRLEVVPVPQP
jgi:hypothetical protein